jgi:hypothetical protein
VNATEAASPVAFGSADSGAVMTTEGATPKIVTVTVGALTEEQPAPSVTVSVYVVVADGDAEGAQLFGLSSPVAGLQEQETPPDPASGVEIP